MMDIYDDIRSRIRSAKPSEIGSPEGIVEPSDAIELPPASSIQQENADARAMLEYASTQDPDEYARKLDVANRTGLSVEDVEAAPDETEALLKKISPDVRLQFYNAGLSNFLRKDRKNAIIAQDDIDVLKRLEDAFGKRKEWWEFEWEPANRNLGQTFPEGIKQGLRSGELFLMEQAKPEYMSRLLPFGGIFAKAGDVARLLGFETPDVETGWREALDAKANALKQEIEAGEKRIEDLTPENLTIMESGWRSGLQSLGENLPGIGMSFLFKTPTPALAMMSSLAGSRSYGSCRAEGRSHSQCMIYGAIDGALEWLWEKTPTGVLVNLFKNVKGGKGKTLREAARFAITDVGGEQGATLTQDLNAYAFGLNEQLAQARTLSEFLEIQSRQQLVTFISTLVSGSGQMGLAYGAGAAANALQKKRNKSFDEVGNALRDQARLDDIIRFSQVSKTADRSADTMKEFVDGLDVTEDIYVDVEAAERLEGYDDIIAPQLDGSGVDVKIPADVFVNRLARDPVALEIVRPHLKLDPLGMTMADLETGEASSVRKLFERAAKAKETKQQADAVWETVVDQLVASKRMSLTEARAAARIIPAYVTVATENIRKLGDRVIDIAGRTKAAKDVTVEDVFRKMNLKIVGPREIVAEERERMRIVDQLEQTQIELQDVETGEAIEQSAMTVLRDADQRVNTLTRLIECMRT